MEHLKPRGLEQLRTMLDKNGEAESFVSQLCSVLLELELSALMAADSNPRTIAPFYFKNSTGLHLSICFEGGTQSQDATYFKRLLDLAKRLGRARKNGVPSPISELKPVEVAHFWGAELGACYQLNSHTHGRIGKVWIGSNQPLVGIQATEALFDSAELKTKVTLWASVMKDRLEPTRMRAHRYWLRVPQRDTALIYPADLISANDKYIIIIKENCTMSEEVTDDKNMQISLCLGDIEMSISDLMRMRPGMKVEFEKPLNFEASLEIGGAKWADAIVQLQNDCVSLEIKRIGEDGP